MTAATTTRREVAIDTQLAGLWTAAAQARAGIEASRLSLASHLGIRPYYVTRNRREVRETLAELLTLAAARMASDEMPWKKQELERALERLRTHQASLAAARAAAAPMEADFNANPWSRFFLVTNAGGHIHSDMSCSTCRITTDFVWLPDLSGLTEKDAVDAHGPLLCSVCYPSAPVEWTIGNVKEAPADRCPGSGTHDHDSSGLRYASPRATCNHCGQVASVTSTGKMRQHKTEAA